MSWSQSRTAIQYSGVGGSDYDSPVSPSTVESDRFASALRMFFGNLSGLKRAAAFPVDADAVNRAGIVPSPGVNQYVSYIDSDYLGEFSRDDTWLSATYIPNQRDTSNWRLERAIHGTIGPVFPSRAPILVPDSIPASDGSLCVYSEPCVLSVPARYGGGWLMLLRRSRTVVTLASGETAHPTTYLGEPASESTISDIICYWSENLNFTDPSGSGGAVLKGPVLLVDSLDALPDFKWRVFTGVPSAAFASASDVEQGQARRQAAQEDAPALYVYYAVDFPAEAHLECEDAGYQLAIAASDYLFFQKDGRGIIAAKRIEWHDLRDALGKNPIASAKTNESTWTSDSAVKGTLLGRVRLWVPQPFSGSHRRAIDFLSRSHAGSYTIARTTDPEAEVCDDALMLFFTGLHAKPTTSATIDLDWIFGHGVWRASAMPGFVTLFVEDDADPAKIRTTEFGVDFVIAFADTGSPGPDLVLGAAESASALTTTGVTRAARFTPADPDVVHWRSFPTGATVWSAFLGSNTFATGLPSGAPSLGGVSPSPSPAIGAGPRKFDWAPSFLARVTGDDSDGCRSWEDAWSFPDILVP